MVLDLAVRDNNGDLEVYVVDTENMRIQVFSADAAILRKTGKYLTSLRNS